MQSDLEKVKTLLLGQEYAELLELKKELQTSEALTETVAGVIAEALESRTDKDDRVADVLAPTIDQAIAGSIDQDPKKLAESLYPIMGPAIRKSISETLQQMLENFNQLLEQSLSPRSLRWRFDAWRTGRSYSELVLLNTLEYEVEQVFFIHTETSLLIRHVYSEFSERKDPDMVSGMFSAIQDFIEDSFSVSEGDTLDTLRLGELHVVLQRGPNAVLASVVRGNIPEHLRPTMQDISENLHRTKKADLQDYAGDPSVFDDIEEDLHSILEIKQKQEEEERSIPWLAIVAIFVAMGFAGYYSYLHQQKIDYRQTLIEQLDQEPGIVVLSDSLSDETHLIAAMVDPHARKPAEVMADPDDGLPAFSFETHPYLSAEDAIIAIRAALKLEPAEGTNLTVNNGGLVLSGDATAQWVRMTEQTWGSITGITSVNTSDLNIHNPILTRLNQYTENAERFSYAFEREAIEIDPEDPKLIQLADSLREILAMNEQEKLSPIGFDLVGYTDDSGSARLNRRIGSQRAQTLKGLLVLNGVPAELMRTYNSITYHSDVPDEVREVRVFVKRQDAQ